MSLLKDLFNKKMLICIGTGFSQGLPYFVLGNMIQAWLKDYDVDIKTIGLIGLTGLPYTWKFLWSPVLDRYRLPFLGRRRGWALLSQTLLMTCLWLFSLFDPSLHMTSIAILMGVIAFLSASQDIVLDAYRRELLSDRELGIGNGYYANAYRLAGFIPGSLALILADYIPWSAVHLIVGAFMAVGIACTLMMPEPKLSEATPPTFRLAVIEPFREFFTRRGVRHAMVILSFILLYKLGDSMATALATNFYMDLGHSKTVIGSVVKAANVWGVAIGMIVGGAIMLKIGINRSLWLFGLAQMVTILGFAALSTASKTLPIIEGRQENPITTLSTIDLGEDIPSNPNQYFMIENVPSSCKPNDSECVKRWDKKKTIKINSIKMGDLQNVGFSKEEASKIDQQRKEKGWIANANALSVLLDKETNQLDNFKISYKIQANTAKKSILSNLPGLNEQKGEKLIECRQSHFLSRVEDLTDHCQIELTTASITQLKDVFQFKIDPNSANGQELSAVPGLEPSKWLLFVVVLMEYLGVGLGTAAYMAYMASITDKRYTATQFALLTSIMAMPRTAAVASSGYLIEAMGYTPFFFLCFAIALPGMVLLLWVAPWSTPKDSAVA